MIGFVNAGDAYWDYLAAGELRLCRCAECGHWLWDSYQGGIDVRCGECGSWTIEWTPVELRGTVYSWVVTNQAVDGVESFHDQVPYVTIEASVAPPDGPRVLGTLRGSAEGLRIGAPVVGEIQAPSAELRGYAALRWRLATDRPEEADR